MSDPAAHPRYVDLYTLPVPEGNLEAYKRQAALFGEVAREYGALGYREFVGDDLGDNWSVEEGVLLTAAIAEFRSREHRDEVMAKVMADERVKRLLDGEPPALMERMSFGGFSLLIDG